MPIYSYQTLGQATAQLGERLYDTGSVFWTDAEKELYIVESLRNWNALANFWRGDFTFQSVASQRWYDLSTQANSLRPMTVTDQDLLTIMEYHLLEPQTSTYPLVWTGSKQFSIDDLLGAIGRRRDEALSVTGCTVTRSTIGAPAGNPASVVTLPDTTLELRRVAWLPVTSPAGYRNTPLFREDSWAQQDFSPGFSTYAPGQPGTYSQSSQPPISFLTDRAPAVAGDYEILSLLAGSALSVVAATILTLPDDWCWIIKWGALADLFSRESNAKDPLRAKYCELRYREGLGLLAGAPAPLTMRLNNNPLQIDAVQSADYYRPGWEAETAGQPDTAYTSGLNLVALAAVPDAGPYSLTASVVQNAPIPADPTKLIQMSRDDYDVMLDYAQHLAMVKCGGQEFVDSLPLYDRFLKAAAVYNSKLSEQGSFQKAMYDVSQLDPMFNNRYSPEADPARAMAQS